MRLKRRIVVQQLREEEKQGQGKCPHVGRSGASMPFETTHSLGEHDVLLPDAVLLVNGRETKKQSLTRNTKDCKLLEASALSGHLHAGEILPAQVDPSQLVPELILRDILDLPRLRPVPNARANIAIEKGKSTRNINSGDIQLVFSQYDSFICLKLNMILSYASRDAPNEIPPLIQYGFSIASGQGNANHIEYVWPSLIAEYGSTGYCLSCTWSAEQRE